MKAGASHDDRLGALECLRGIAGFYVFLHHFAHIALQRRYPRFARLFVLGQPAVMIFFIMSGFVIFYSTKEESSFREYFIRRFRRIYPLYLVAMLLAYFAQCVAQRAWVAPGGWHLLGNLLMLQDGGDKPGVWTGPFLGNAPLWSLSYEWFFYLAFFPVFRWMAKWPGQQRYVVAGLSLTGFFTYFAWPNPISTFLMYFVLWWSGVELAREWKTMQRITLRGQATSLLAVGVLTILWSSKVVAARAEGNMSAFNHPGLEFRHFLTTLVILVVGLAWYRLGAKGFYWVFGWGRYLAPISYAVYICHAPVIVLATVLHLFPTPTLDFVWVLPAVLGLSWLLERKLQPAINDATKGMLRARCSPGQ